MNRIYFLLIALMVSANFGYSQTTQLNESFTDPFNVSAAGWYQQNNSSPLGTMTWAQGVGTVFPASSGNSTDYFRDNFNSQGSSSGSISDFLITPTVSLMNGGVLQFYSRTINNPSQYPDRLRVLMSIGTGTGAIPNSVTGVGTFTVTLLTINPNLSTNVYPAVWTLFTTTLTGITGTVTGRFAFRYDVPNGGPAGANSDYIGIDDVKYTTAAPCPSPTITVSPSYTTICSGQYANITFSGANTYSMNGFASPSNINVNPQNTTEFTVAGTSSQGCYGTSTFTVEVLPFPVVSVANVTTCPGGQATLVATGATSYSWSNGATTSSIVVTVNSNTVYSVTGSNAPGCDDFTSASVTTNTFLFVPDQNVTACPDAPYILGASGASTYTWNTGATTPSIVITPTGGATYFVTGTSNGCNETKKIDVTIDPNLFAPSFTTCAGTSATLVVTGASSYTWSTGATNSIIVVSPTANTVYSVEGKSGNCSQTKTLSVTIGNNLSVVTTQSCVGTVMLLQGYGASSYTWYPSLEHTQFIFVNPTGPTVYTLAGTSGSCAGTQTIGFTVCPGILEINNWTESLSIFPNPFNGELTISGINGHVSLVNTIGQVLFDTEVKEQVMISTLRLPQGVYFVVITDPVSASRAVRKVIKD